MQENFKIPQMVNLFEISSIFNIISFLLLNLKSEKRQLRGGKSFLENPIEQNRQENENTPWQFPKITKRLEMGV